jgi:hypothetical protein
LEVSEEAAVRLKRQVEDRLQRVWRNVRAEFERLMGEVWVSCCAVGTGFHHLKRVQEVLRNFITSEERGGALNMFLQLICILVQGFDDWAMVVFEWFLISVAPGEDGDVDDDVDLEWR